MSTPTSQANAATRAIANATSVNGYRPRRLKKAAWNLIPAATFIAIILVWGLAVWIFEVPSYLLPGPIEVLNTLVERAGELWEASLVTMSEIALGFLLSIVIAIPLGLLIALSKVARQIVYPPVVFMQLIPKIAVAPLFVVWMGLGMESKVVLTILMTFFPLLIASISGFRILDERLLYLTKSMGATTFQTFRYLRFPAALPVIFSGLKTSATMAATAAIVAEFVGANEGLGYILLQGTSRLDTPIVFAVLVILTVIGLALNYIVEFVEWLLTPWQRSKNG
jgi:NitT/TauT family transport system permease protein